MHCWKCHSQLEEQRLPFRAICDRCSAWLHCCVNCSNYRPGLPNDCQIPGTEPIGDRSSCNFCEEFQPAVAESAPPSASINEASLRLFGEESEPQKKSFDDLFDD